MSFRFPFSTCEQLPRCLDVSLDFLFWPVHSHRSVLEISEGDHILSICRRHFVDLKLFPKWQSLFMSTSGTYEVLYDCRQDTSLQMPRALSSILLDVLDSVGL